MSDTTKMDATERVQAVTTLVETLIAATTGQPHSLVMDALLTLYFNVAMRCPVCAATAANALPLIARQLDAFAAQASSTGNASHAIH